MAGTSKHPDIEILAGLKGGGTLSGESGQLIQQQLTAIANSVTFNVTAGLKGGGTLIGESGQLIQQQLTAIANSLTFNVKASIDDKTARAQGESAGRIYVAALESQLKGVNISEGLSGKTPYARTKQQIKLSKDFDISAIKVKEQALKSNSAVIKSNASVAKSYISLFNDIRGISNSISASVSKVSEPSEALQKTFAKFNKVQKKVFKIDTSTDQAEVAKLIAKFQELAAQINQLTNLERATQSDKKVYSYKELVSLLRQQVSAIEEELRLTDRSTQETRDYVQALREAAQQKYALAKSNSNLSDDEYKALVEEQILLTKKLFAVKAELDRYTNDAEQKKRADIDAYNSSLEKTKATIQQIAANYPKIDKNSELSAEFTRIQSALSNLGELDSKGLKQINTDLATLKKKLDLAGLGAQSLGTKFKNAIKKFAQYLGASTIVLRLIQGVKQMYRTVVSLDTAMTDLRIASGATRDEVEKMMTSFHDLAAEVGATTVEVAKAADTWLRQGYDAAEANELIRASMMLSKLGQIESADASKALTSAMKGYKVAVEDVTDVVDKLTAVDMKAAVSAGDIATAMAETAVSADVAGLSMDKLIGYLSVVAEITQDGAESVGNFMKTLLARMGNIKAGRLIDPETEESLKTWAFAA